MMNFEPTSTARKAPALAKRLTAFEAKERAQQIAFAPIIFKASLALRNLGLLALIQKSGNVGSTLEEIAEQTSISLYGLKVLMAGGIHAGILAKNQTRYILTNVGHFFLHDEMTRVNTDFVNDVCYRALDHTEESIVTGKPAGLKELGEWQTIYEGLSALPKHIQDSWFAFDHFYSDDVFDTVVPIILKNNPASVMDIGGNTGKFAIKCLQHRSALQITIVDLPGQLAMAKQNTQPYFDQGKIKLFACDLLQPEAQLPPNTDAIWMSQFLDCFSETQVVSILKRCREVMGDNTLVYILEPLTDTQKFDAAYLVVELTSLYFTVAANGNSRMYSYVEMAQMIERAGLEIAFVERGLGICQTLIACRKNKEDIAA